MGNDSHAGKPAGFWIRFLAQLIDSVVMVIPALIIFFIFGLISFAIHDSEIVERLVGAAILICLGGVSLLYYSLMTSKKGQTLGKMAFNIKVVDKEGNPPSFGRSVGRWFSYILSGIPACIGYLLAAFDQEKKALHDRLAGTRVVYVGAPNTAAIVLTVVIGLGGAILTSSLVAAFILPEMLHMKKMAGLSANKVNLQNIRNSILIYYTDKMAYPAGLQSLVPKYMDSIPETDLKTFGHSPSHQVESYPFLDAFGSPDPTLLKDTGHWLYDPKTGKVVIDCTDKDNGGDPIYTY